MNRAAGVSSALMALCLGTLLMLTACGGTASTEPASTPAEQPATEQPAATPSTPEEDALYTPAYQPNGDETAVFKTSKGDITVEFYGKDAPIAVGNFIELAQKGFYDDVKFHRYEPGFVIQGGDPQTKGVPGDQVAAGQGGAYGTGGPGYTIKDEYDPAVNPNKHVDGALAMARTQAPNSAGSQFYFTLGAQSFLDGQYTVFGQVTEGMDVVRQLRAGDAIVSVEIQNAK